MKLIASAAAAGMLAGVAAANTVGPEMIPSSYATALPAVDEGLHWKWGPGLSAKDADGNSIKIGGRTFVDYTFASTGDNYPLSRGEGVEFRTARLYVEGKLASGIFFKSQFDFAGQDADFKDVFLGMKAWGGKVRAGHFKQPLGLEQNTSSKYITFLERGAALGTGRDTGIMYNSANEDDTVTYAVGIFQPVGDSGNKIQPVGADDYHLTGRVTFLPSHDDNGDVIHVGAAVSQRNTTPSFSARPNNHLFGKLSTPADTGDDHTIIAVEGAGVWGQASAQVEVMMTSSDNLDFMTAYVLGSYFLTEGDRRTYKKSAGSFDRVKPQDPKNKGGDGAIEVALRFETTDYDDTPGAGTANTMDNITLGLNWYLTSHTRLMANIISSSAETGGVDDDAEIFAIRFQTDF